MSKQATTTAPQARHGIDAAGDGSDIGCLLVTSWCVPPNLTGSSVIVDGLSQQFARDQMVIIGQNWRTLAEYERPADRPEIQYFGNEWTWPRRGQRYVRWIRWFTLPALVSKITRLARRAKSQAILGILPNEYFLLASYMAAQATEMPLYPFLHNTYIENRTGWPLRLAKWLEPRIFRTSPVVFVANDGMRALTRRFIPGCVSSHWYTPSTSRSPSTKLRPCLARRSSWRFKEISTNRTSTPPAA